MKNNMKCLIDELANQVTKGDLIASEQLAIISSVIVKSRLERKMSQKEFAQLLGVSQGMISKWESQNYNFSIEALANICDKLNLEMNVEIKPVNKGYKKMREENWNINFSGGKILASGVA